MFETLGLIKTDMSLADWLEQRQAAGYNTAKMLKQSAQTQPLYWGNTRRELRVVRACIVAKPVSRATYWLEGKLYVGTGRQQSISNVRLVRKQPLRYGLCMTELAETWGYRNVHNLQAELISVLLGRGTI